ncbi:MAG: hypothetical protein GY791_06385 [Alphaproteobacteria bacterium]|nr:hypothetical protein [Alphaproteobacteria bacterium]
MVVQNDKVPVMPPNGMIAMAAIGTSAGRIVRNLAVAVLWFGALFLAGCGTSSVEASCSSFGYGAVPANPERIYGDTYSVLTPQGEGWCIVGSTDTSQTFFYHPWIGRTFTADDPPDEDYTTNTFALAVYPLQLTAAEGDRARDLAGFVKEWVGGLMPNRAAGRVRMTAKIDTGRFTVLDNTVELQPRMEAECVRFEMRSEERRNPKLPGAVMLIHVVGIACRHPTDSNLLAVIAFSERLVVGKQLDPSLFDRLERTAVEPVFRSLELAKAS